MSRIAGGFCLVACMCASVVARAALGPPLLLSEQGQLVDQEDIPIYDQVNVTFRLYQQPTGGQPIWQEVHTLTPDDGFFNVTLGEYATINLEWINGAPLYLGIQVNTDPEMTPREEFG